jgi:dihydroneopterin aldolase
LTPRARGALDLASKEALSFGHDYVGTEHVLLGLVCEFGSIAAQVLYRLGADADGIRREVTRMLSDGRETVIRDPNHVAGLAHTTMFRARVEGLVVQARCGGVGEEERALPQTLRVDLDWLYEAEEGDDLLGTVDYGDLIEGVVRLLEQEEFRLLETGARMMGRHILERFPLVREVTVTVAKLRAPVVHEVSEVSVEATFGR